MKAGILLVILFLLSLTACSAKLVHVPVQQEIPPIPAEPEYYSVSWIRGVAVSQESVYCTTEEGAKALLKNILLMKSYEEQLRAILEELKKD